ncbi:hypothetical protein MKEN_00896800 [Mycena kentingensis (nom. inval.)]|nr:hypothetical protein MKEN_00896800 [Mycena kentingensis (nom. inval.)]
MSLSISNTHLIGSTHPVRIECTNGRISAVLPADSGPADIDAEGGLLIPSFCHAHIHLDKCFILDRCKLETGDFAEALRVTNEAKAAFEPQDLYKRGTKLIRESIECGVTAMRAHVEIDRAVKFACLEAGVELRDAFRDVCDVQVAAFAQEPLFDDAETSEPGENYTLLAQALEKYDVKVVGSAPYVEPTIEQAKRNIGLILNLALAHQCHVDFHLDYNLDPSSEPLIFSVIAQANALSWPPKLRIAIGHATRLQLFTPAQWDELVKAIGCLPISLIGLPQSDIYMMGRAMSRAPRGTLHVPQIAREHNLHVAMSVNNVQNAFTPQGSLDPLALCTLGVSLFQAATPNDLRTLLRAVSLTCKEAIASPNIANDLSLSVGDPADFVILHSSPDLASAVLNPSYDRTTVRHGVVVARRRTERWIAGPTDNSRYNL